MKKTCFPFLVSIFTILNSLLFAQPIITTFSPVSGSIGTLVTITGTNFNTTAANNIVFFGATQAVINSASSTSLNVTVPAGATYQYISVTDTITGQTAYSAIPFDVTFPCGNLINSSSFSPKTDFSAGTYIYSLTSGDLDGDGKPDIVTANPADNIISVFKNTSVNSAVSFAAKVDYTAGVDPRSVFIGDLDGDGKPDIIAANHQSNTVSIFKNTSVIGIISFAPKVDYATGNNPLSIAINDLDGDGKPDIAVSNLNSNTISVLKNISNSGAISFATKVDFATGGTCLGISMGDLDGDEKSDLVVAIDNIHTISVFRNTCTNGTISFAAGMDFPAGDGINNPRFIAISDLDGNGKLDIAIVDNGSSIVSILSNISTIGTISLAPPMNFATGGTTWGISIGNIDGDNKPDLAITNVQTHTLSILKNTSVSGNISFASKIDFAMGTNPYNIAISDLDGDGRPDLEVANAGSSTFSVLKNLIGTLPTMTSANSVTLCSGESVNIPLTSDESATYIWSATDNPNTTGESVILDSTNNLNNTIINNTSSFQTVTYNIIPTSQASSCAGTSQTLTVTINPTPIVGFTGLNLSSCHNASAETLTGVPAGGTFSGSGISGNIFSPSLAGSGIDSITYTYTDGNFCTNTSIQFTEILPLPPIPTICMVTVDSMSRNNVIYWDKTIYTTVDSFIVYRETLSNVYKRIGVVSMDSLSLFVDTVRHLYFPFTGNPNAGTYRYKLQIRDTCGNYSLLSPYHNTIYVNQTGGTFTFNDYQIEGEATPITSLNGYFLYRDNNSTGNWVVVNGVSGSQLTITDPDNASYPNASWRIETQWDISCTATRAINTARSNIKGQLVSGLSDMNQTDTPVSIYPNPYSENTTITYTLNKKSNVIVEVYSTIGQKVETLVNINQTAGEYKCSFSARANGFNAGVYFVKINIDGKVTVKRIVEIE
ncbi:MAG: FG-GAP-like repeat-containing protein [Bacteroidota bacterium]